MTLTLLIVSCMLSLALHPSVWLHPQTSYVGVGPDPEQAIWFLNWFPFALSHHHNPWLSDFMNFPHGFNVTWNTGIPLLAVVLWPLTTHAGPLVAYNLVMTASPPLSALCAYVAIRRLVPNGPASALGGLLYGFSPFMISHSLGHPDLVAAFIPPLLLGAIAESLTSQRRRWWVAGLVIGLLATLQLFIGEEVLTIAGLTAGLAMLALAMQFRHDIRRRSGHALRTLLFAGGVTATLSAWPLAIQLFGPERPTRSIQPPDVYVSDALNLVVPTLSSERFAPPFAVDLSTRFTGNAAESSSYLGIPLLLLLIFVCFRHRRDPLVRTLAVTAVMLTVLSMGPHLHVGGTTTGIPLPWMFVQKVPIIGYALPGRLMQFVFLISGALLAVFIDRTWSPKRWSRTILTSAITALALLPLMPASAPIRTGVRVPSLFVSPDIRRVPPGSPALVLPYDTFVSADSGDPLVWQAETQMRYRSVGGYYIVPAAGISEIPRLRDTLVSLEKGSPESTIDVAAHRAEFVAEMRKAGVQTVISGPAPHRQATLRFLQALLGPPSFTEAGLDAWFDVHTATPV